MLRISKDGLRDLLLQHSAVAERIVAFLTDPRVIDWVPLGQPKGRPRRHSASPAAHGLTPLAHLDRPPPSSPRAPPEAGDPRAQRLVGLLHVIPGRAPRGHVATGLAIAGRILMRQQKRPSMPTEIAPRVTVDPAVCLGKPVIAGTRVPVAVVVEELAAGETAEEVRRQYDLEPEDVRAALAYAARLLGQEEFRIRVG